MNKLFAALLIILITSELKAQEYDLTDKNTVISLLHKKTFIVPNYGEIRFKYDGFKYGEIKFEVDYTVVSGRSRKTYNLYTSIAETYGGFHIAEFCKDFRIAKKEELEMERREFPTMFQLLQNGELYYKDKPKQTFKEYYETTIKKGNINPLKLDFIRCPEK